VRSRRRGCPWPTSGGIFQDGSIHDIDLVCWTLGGRRRDAAQAGPQAQERARGAEEMGKDGSSP
jgi:predicted dehydrogenase